MVIAIISTIIFFILIIPVSYYLFFYVYEYNNQVGSVIDKVEVKQFKEAKIVYNKIKNRKSYNIKTKVVSAIANDLNDRINKLSNDYIDDKLKYDEIDAWYKGLKEFDDLKKIISDKQNDLKKYKESKEYMTSANNLKKDNNYLDAIEKYKKVIKEDKKNYTNALVSIKNCIKDMYGYYIKEAENMNKKGEYENAYNTINSFKKYYPDDKKLKSTMDNYLNNYYNSIIKKADELNSKNKFDEAIYTIETLNKYFSNDKKLEGKIIGYKRNKIEAAIKEQERQEKRKKELLAKTSKKHIKDKNIDLVVPKGFSTTYTNVSETVNIEPKLIVGDNTFAVIAISVGFVQDRFINYKKVVFDIDGEIVEYEVSDEYKKVQSGYGLVAEWSLLFYRYDKNIDEIKKIANGKNVKIIFEGKKYRSHVLTKNEKDNLKLFVELYGFYNYIDDPEELISQEMV